MKPLKASLKKFIREQEMVRLSWLGEGGHPRVVPVWFVTIGGRYYVGTGVDSAKWKAIEHDSRVAWVIDGGKKGNYKGISMHGWAEQITDKRTRAKIYREFGKKYFGSANHPKHIEIWGEVDDAGSVYIHLKQEDGFWWEY